MNDIIKLLLLQNTYKSNPHFMFHKTRHTNLYAYKNDIHKQNSYLATSHVVPIQGISNDLMFFLDHEIFTIQDVIEILPHKEAQEKSCFSIMTK